MHVCVVVSDLAVTVGSAATAPAPHASRHIAIAKLFVIDSSPLLENDDANGWMS